MLKYVWHKGENNFHYEFMLYDMQNCNTHEYKYETSMGGNKMKKQNFGIPAMLLCISAYALATVNLWTVIALTILVFAFNFEPKVRKTALQASALSIFFVCVDLVFSLLAQFVGSSGYGSSITNIFSDDTGVNVLNKFIYGLDDLMQIAETIIFVILIVCILIKNDIVLQSVTKAVDGFVPPQPNQYQQPMQQQPMQQANQYVQQPQQPNQYVQQPNQFQQPQNPNQPR